MLLLGLLVLPLVLVLGVRVVMIMVMTMMVSVMGVRLMLTLRGRSVLLGSGAGRVLRAVIRPVAGPFLAAVGALDNDDLGELE